MPALPLGDAGPYVAAAYLVFLALVLIYVAIMAVKLGRIQREIGELVEVVERHDAAARASDGPVGAGGATARAGGGGEHEAAPR